MAPWRKALREVKALQAMISILQPALVWCGHLHYNSELKEGDSRIFCTSSASLVHRASYRVFDIGQTMDGGRPCWSIHMQLKSCVRGTAGFRAVNEQRWNFKL